jgi:hypothetical protein
MKKQHILDALIIGLLLAPIVLLFLPADFFDYGQALCPSKRFLDIECLGCGMSRAVQHTIHLEFKTAWEYNKLIIIVFPVLFYKWVTYSIIYLKKAKNYFF